MLHSSNHLSIYLILLLLYFFPFIIECDIRSCLNTLQFLSKKKEALNVVRFSAIQKFWWNFKTTEFIQVLNLVLYIV